MTAVIDFLLAGFTDNSGNPLSGGKVYTYAAGTTTPKATYTDSGLSTPEANPIILDSNGRKEVFASGSYKFLVKTSADVLLYTYDNLFLGDTQNFSGAEAINLGNATARTSAITYGQVQDGVPPYVASVGGSANVITLTPTVAISAYAAGQYFRFIAANTNTGVTTINISGKGAVALRKGFSSSVDLSPGDIPAGAIIEVICDGTVFRLVNVATLSYGSVAAAGTTQGTATAITKRVSYISSGTLHQGLVLPAAKAGAVYEIISPAGISPVCIYPASGESFNSFSANQFVTLLTSQSLRATCYVDGTWQWEISGGIFQQGITATGTTAAAGYQLLYPYSSVSVVTGAANAVTLPHPYPGMQMMVCNFDAADNLIVFPASGDTINGAGRIANDSISVAFGNPGDGLMLYGISNSAWMAVLADAK